MIKKTQLKPIAAALGTTFAVTLAMSPLVNAADNPFAVTEFKGGYMVAAGHGEGGCGEDKAKDGEGKCGEGKSDAEGKCGN